MNIEAEERIQGLAKRYQSMLIISPELTDELATLKGEIDTEMRGMSADEQNRFTHKMRERSIAVNGQEPATYTGYGVIRDVFCDILVDRLSESAQLRYNLIQNGMGSSQNAQDITNGITDIMMSLPRDQFETFTNALNTYTIPTENQGVPLSQSAINRKTFGVEEIRRIRETVERQRLQRDGSEREL